MSNIDVDALIKNEANVSIKSMCYKTVDVFAGILDRKLWLKEAKDGVPKTNGYLIEVPFTHPRVYQYTEHEISHILFQSDAIARVKFLSEYSTKISKVAKKSGAPINDRLLRQGLNSILAVLDDERVISLWGLLYRGSEQIMRHMKLDEAKQTLPHAHENFVCLLYCLASGNDVPFGKLDRFRPYMLEALRKVRLRDYFGCLVTTKWLVVQLVSEIIRESRGELPPAMSSFHLGTAPHGRERIDEDDEGPIVLPWEGQEDDVQAPREKTSDENIWEPPEVNADVQARAEALQNVVNSLGELPPSETDEVEESKFKRRGEEEASSRKAQAALITNVKDSGKLEHTLSASSAQMFAIVRRSRNTIRNAVHDDDRIRKNAYAKVIFTDVEPSEHMDPHLKLTDDDEETTRRLRAIFYRTLGRKVNVLEYAGNQIDIPAYIERKVTNQPIPVFRIERFGRGFKTIILIDRSHSMKGFRTAKAEKACQIISRSLKFPFVDTSVWGFQSWTEGEVTITRFRAGHEVFDSESATVGGVTPLHVAIRVALKALELGTEKKHLFVISDGWPVYASKNGFFGTQTLMNFVRRSVMKARSKGIGVTGVMIGKKMPKGKMAFMFGPSKYWRILEEESFHKDLVQLVSRSFLEYLWGS